MIPTVIFILLFILAILLILFAIGWNFGWHSVGAATIAALIMWMLTVSQSAGQIGESVVMPLTANSTGNLTSYTYDIVSVPILNTVLTYILVILSVACTIYALYIVILTLYDTFAQEDQE